jgi:hypothetical protein
LGGVKINSWRFNDRTEGYKTTTQNVGWLQKSSISGGLESLCPQVGSTPQCQINWGAGTSGCGKYVTSLPAVTNHLKCKEAAYGAPDYVERTSVVAQKCVRYRNVMEYTHWIHGCPEWARYGGSTDRQVKYGGATRDIQDHHWWRPTKNQHFQKYYNHGGSGNFRYWGWAHWGGRHFHLYRSDHGWKVDS